MFLSVCAPILLATASAFPSIAPAPHIGHVPVLALRAAILEGAAAQEIRTPNATGTKGGQDGVSDVDVIDADARSKNGPTSSKPVVIEGAQQGKVTGVGKSIIPDLHVPTATKGLDLVIPSSERLAFLVELDMVLVGKMRVGSFVITSKVEKYQGGLPRPGASNPGTKKKYRGYIKAEAAGGYAGYKLDHLIDARILPQEWPRVIVRDYQSGTENRRREVMYGTRAGNHMSWYRRDRHCEHCDRREHFVKSLISSEHHCKGCKRGEHRDWDTPKMQQVPEGALDMISAIFLARGMLTTNTEAVEFPLLDKDSYWDLRMVLGERAQIKTPAGYFNCRAVKLDPKPPEGAETRKDFKGLFGIHGTLSIWLHETTGVPVKIEGLVPLGPLDLDVAILLAEFQDTDPRFKVSEKK